MAKRKKTDGWDAAGAARAARESRIASVGFLRDAPLAREMQAYRLMALHQTKAEHLHGRGDAALQLMVTGLGYPEDWIPASYVDMAETVISDQANDLAAADLYILSPQMCDVVVAAALSLTLDDLALLAEDDVPTRRGLVVLPRPLMVKAINGDLSDDRAYGWNATLAAARVDLETQDWIRASAVRVTSYYDTNGPVQPDSFRQLAARARSEKTPLPPLMLDGIQCTWFGLETTAEHRKAMDRYVETTQRRNQAMLTEAEELGLDESRVTGEYTPGSAIDDHDSYFSTRFLYAFWRLCEQTIADVTDAEVRHAARITAERAGVPPEVRVAQLRPSNRNQADTKSAEGRWNHRWVVRMHKVRQWYPSEQRHKVLYRGPYIKGPDDKPFLGGEVVRSLTAGN